MNSSLRRRRGFSLVELLVSVVIGMLALLFATRLVISGEQNKDAAVGGSETMQNGMLALFSLSGDAGMAGWGINDHTLNGCATNFTDTSGYQLLSVPQGAATVTPLAAVVIQSNGVQPDVVSFNSGSSQTGIGALMVKEDYTNGSYLVVEENAYGFNDRDVLVVAPNTPGLPCTVMQMSGYDSGTSSGHMLIKTGSNYRFNAQAGLTQAYSKSVTWVYNLGQPERLHFHTWSVNNGILLLRAAELAGATASGVSVVDNIVSLKAQYGFDTRVDASYDPNPAGNGTQSIATSSGMQIGQWSSTMIDADGDGVVGGPGDYQRIAAVRLAVVARSKTIDKPNASGACTATTVRPTVFGTAAPASVAAVPVQVNVAVTGDTVSWTCYRYRVFETIVPILNSQFRS